MHKSVGIIGLGLMGGSLGLSMRAIPFIKNIVGLDHNKAHEVEALKLGLVDEIVSFERIQQCDIIVLTIPVEGIIATLQAFDAVKEDTLIIDLGSTKNRIVENVPAKIRKNFVAAHPMAGTEKFGPTAAFASLYTHKVVALCDLDASGTTQVTLATRLFEALQMRIITMNAIEHDQHVAYISHLPHAISYALANTVLAHEDTKNILNLAASGFKDMSRLAKSSPQMWEDIFRQNKTNLLMTIEAFQHELETLKENIKEENWHKVNAKMKSANSLHDIL